MHVPDHDRTGRIGMPEAVLCGDKTDAQLAVVIDDLAAHGGPHLLTRLAADRVARMDATHRELLDHDPVSSTAVLGGRMPARPGRVAIAAAGTSDQAVAAEAARTLEFSGVAHDLHVDIGVAALWRLQERLDQLRAADVVLVVAGMDAALVSVLGGLVGSPVVAVPTSVGYGVAAGGTTALHSALASCAQGVTVVNVDNGFGGACAAVRILSLLGDRADGRPSA